MQKIKPIIIILVIFAILIIMMMIVVSKLDSDKNRENNIIAYNEIRNNIVLDDENQPDATEKRVTADNITKLNNTNTFFSIEECIRRYFLYLRAGNSKAVFDIIEKQYKNLNEINEKNILEVLREGIPYDGKYTVKDIYVREDNYKPIYFVRGTLEKTPYYLIMKQDKANSAFSLKPITENEYEMYIQERNNESFEENIKLGEYNKIINVTLTKEEIVEKYFNSYIQNARYSTKEAYNSLDEEYREKRFGNYQNYVSYLLEENKAKQLASLDHNSIRQQEEFSSDEEYAEYINSLSQTILKKYATYTENEKEYYICLDAYDNFYIFEISSIMNYKLYLDSYTVGLGYFLNQYTDEDTTIEEKGQINVQKIFEAINNKDYRYIYNKIDKKVRTEKFGNYDSFVEYMRENLLDMNSIEFDESLEEDNLCTEKLIVTDKEGKDTREILMTILLELDNENSYEIKDIQFE